MIVFFVWVCAVLVAVPAVAWLGPVVAEALYERSAKRDDRADLDITDEIQAIPPAVDLAPPAVGRHRVETIGERAGARWAQQSGEWAIVLRERARTGRLLVAPTPAACVELVGAL